MKPRISTIQSRRAFIGAGLALIAAPAIVRISSLMPVKAWSRDILGTAYLHGFKVGDIVRFDMDYTSPHHGLHRLLPASDRQMNWTIVAMCASGSALNVDLRTGFGGAHQLAVDGLRVAL